LTDEIRLCSWVALKSVPEIGDVLCRRLVDHFGTAEEACRASLSDLLEVEGVGLERAGTLIGYLRDRERWEQAGHEVERVLRSGGTMLTLGDSGYPACLREIADAPPLLYLRGALAPEDRFSIAVVGSRDASEYGLRMAARISGDLARKGMTVVSGGARGIDSVAHRAALRAGGRTLAVLGCGLDVAYPAENSRLFAEIEQRGAVLTEFPLGTPPDRGNFPRRNRLISGLSLGVVVVEAAQGSGSLITAAAALEQGREVFAVPGPAGSAKSRGTHALIRSGARLTESADDVVSELCGLLDGMIREPAAPVERVVPGDLSPGEERLLRGLDRTGKNVDRIAEDLGLGTAEVLRGLLSLELRGIARQLPGGRFVVE